MRELALFAGAGGGILGGRLLGWRTVGAVEINDYCRRVLLARQRDGYLERFTIWDDVRTFDGQPWCGHVDVVSGGFPCQAFSTASRGRRVAPDLWPDMLRVVLEVSPRFVLAENVQRPPIERAADDLARHGYSVSIVEAGASALGAPHDRPRFWAVADSDPHSQPQRTEHAEASGLRHLAGLAWETDLSRALGVVHGVANRLDRLGALGNGQVAPLVPLVWRAGMEAMNGPPTTPQGQANPQEALASHRPE